jgi:nucleotide-binding universal stress UspA family protein
MEKMYERILVSLDGSSLAEQALPYAEELARLFNSEITLVCVCEPAQGEYRHMHQLYLDKTVQLLKSRLKEKNPRATAKPVILDGDPATTITDYASQNNIGLIIMASHGRSGIVPWALGSTASKLLHRINIPVLLIRAREANAKLTKKEDIFNRILIPLDGSEAGKAALPHAAALADKLATELILFQAVAPGQHVHTVGGLTYVPFTEQLLDSMKADAEQYLQKVAEELAGTKANIRHEVRIGDPSQEIIKFANEASISLVAISTHGHSAIREWFSGSATYKVLHGGNTPVLLVRAPV